MKVIGLTGGIGSGKSTVAQMFIDMGVPVYIADIEARKLTNNSSEIKTALINLFGSACYRNDVLDRKYVANKVFNDALLLTKLNAIIHPKVSVHFKQWKNKQQAVFCIKEAAILFENNGYQECDLTILVISPEDERIRRVMERDQVSEKAVRARIKNQWSDEKKCELADIVIENTNLEATKIQVKDIYLSIA
jgi:dephospho-CoA kinase